MKIQFKGAAKRLILSLLIGGTLAGCAVYGPPPAAYDPYPHGYGRPVYVAPPVSLDLGFGFYDFGRTYHHHRGHGLQQRHHHGPRAHRGHRGFHRGRH